MLSRGLQLCFGGLQSLTLVSKDFGYQLRRYCCCFCFDVVATFLCSSCGDILVLTSLQWLLLALLSCRRRCCLVVFWITRCCCAHILTMRAKPHGGHAVETLPCNWTRARVRLHTEGSSPAAVPMWPASEGPAKYQGLPPGNARNPAPSSRAHSAWGRVHTAPTSEQGPDS